MLHHGRPVKSRVKGIFSTSKWLGAFLHQEFGGNREELDRGDREKEMVEPTESNQRPPQCHCGALPTELRPHQRDGDCMDSL